MTTFYAADRSPSFHALRAVEAVAGGAVAVESDPWFVRAVDPEPDRRVALVSGGGAGHEPMHAGFVGRGGLDAACPGEVFTSPHSGQILAASRAVARDGGVLHIVKNYTGDRLNFAIAAERLRAQGIAVEELLVDDDLGSENDGVGRRGTAATVVVEKVLGAAADRGLALDDLLALGRGIVAASRTLAVARGAHTAPHADDVAFAVEAGTLEYGVGIHGETARERIEHPGLAALVDRMVGELLEALPAAGAGVVVLVNGLGGASQLELLHVLTEAERALGDRGVALRSAVTGDFTTALDMAGFSLTITVVDEAWLPDWLAPHGTVALPSPRLTVPAVPRVESASVRPAEASPWLQAFADELIGMRDDLNRLDQLAGDGDIGTNLAGASAAALARATGRSATLAADLRSIADAFGSDTGGSSGPLFGLVLQSLADAADAAESDAGDGLAARLLAGARSGAASVTRVGGAQPGDRTMIDALDAAVRASSTLDAAAVDAAIAGAAATRDMVGGRGRSSYLGDRVLGVPDPGAVAMAHVLLVLAETKGERLDAARASVRELLTG